MGCDMALLHVCITCLISKWFINIVVFLTSVVDVLWVTVVAFVQRRNTTSPVKDFRFWTNLWAVSRVMRGASGADEHRLIFTRRRTQIACVLYLTIIII